MGKGPLTLASTPPLPPRGPSYVLGLQLTISCFFPDTEFVTFPYQSGNAMDETKSPNHGI